MKKTWIAAYVRNRREMKLRKWCIEMAARLADSFGNTTGLAEEIYRWVKGDSDKKS